MNQENRLADLERRFRELDRRFRELEARYIELEAKMQRIETELRTDFTNWALRLEARVGQHSADLHGLDPKSEIPSEWWKKIGGGKPS